MKEEENKDEDVIEIKTDGKVGNDTTMSPCVKLEVTHDLLICTCSLCASKK